MNRRLPIIKSFPCNLINIVLLHINETIPRYTNFISRKKKCPVYTAIMRSVYGPKYIVLLHNSDNNNHWYFWWEHNASCSDDMWHICIVLNKHNIKQHKLNGGKIEALKINTNTPSLTTTENLSYVSLSQMRAAMMPLIGWRWHVTFSVITRCF